MSGFVKEIENNQNDPSIRLALSHDEVAKIVSNNPDCPILVDFDYSLFGSNSLERFLATARPRWAASLIVFLVRELFPWHRYDVRKWGRSADAVAAALVAILLPWSLLLWRIQAPRIFQENAEHWLADLLRNIPASRVTIVSFGLNALVKPLLSKSYWKNCKAICVNFPPDMSVLTGGKLHLIKENICKEDIVNSIFITDSEDDADLLNTVRFPCLINPTGKRFIAQDNLYLPLRYTGTAKYGRHVLIEHFFLVDLTLALLAVLTNKLSIFAVISLTALFISFNSVYEIGYFENDMKAASKELNPTLKPECERYRAFPLEGHAWRWAVSFGIAGVGFAALDQNVTSWRALVSLTLSWALVLIATRLVFRSYNRRPEQQRVLIYPVLQALKSLGFAIVIPISLAGASALSAQIVMMWMTYAIYRNGGSFRSLPREETRFVMFIILTTAITITHSQDYDFKYIISILLITLWCGWRVVRNTLKTKIKSLIFR